MEKKVKQEKEQNEGLLDRVKKLERINYQLEEQVKTFETTINTLHGELEAYQEYQKKWLENEQKLSELARILAEIKDRVESG